MPERRRGAKQNHVLVPELTCCRPMNIRQGSIIAGVLVMLFGGDLMSLFQSSATVRTQTLLCHHICEAFTGSLAGQ